MSVASPIHRPEAPAPIRAFEPGTTGWTAADLDDPEIEGLWVRGSYEIVEGVLTVMASSFFIGGHALFELIILVHDQLAHSTKMADFASGVEMVLDEARVLQADAALLTPSDLAKHAEAAKAEGRSDPDRTRILVPPTLIIESVSPGHEAHDRRTKKKWYAEFGVPNYWILDAFAKSLECFRLAGSEYQLDLMGKDQETIQPAIFAGLSIRLEKLWQRATAK